MCIYLFIFLFSIHTDGKKKSISNAIVTKFKQKTFARAAARKGSHTHFSQVSSKPGGTADIWVHKGLDETLLFSSDTNTRAGCFRNTCAAAANLAAMSRPLQAGWAT